MIKQEIAKDLTSINDLNVLTDISYLSYFKNTKSTRALICNRLGIADITIKTILRRLVDQGHIIKERRGIYKINTEVIQWMN